MQFYTISALLVAALVSSTPITGIQKRQATVIETDILTIHNDIAALNDAVDGFNGETAEALNVTATGDHLDASVKAAIADTQASAVLSPNDSGNITDSISAMTQIIPGSLNALVAKEPEFAAQGMDGTIAAQLATLRSDAATFATTLQTKTSASDATVVQFDADIIDKVFASAIARFS